MTNKEQDHDELPVLSPSSPEPADEGHPLSPQRLATLQAPPATSPAIAELGYGVAAGRRDSTVIYRRLEADVGHRLMAHEGKCSNYHGHRYVFLIGVTGAVKQYGVESGMVIDFSIVKGVVGHWIDQVLDHGMVLQEGDPLIPVLREQHSKVHVVDFAPTIENLCAYVANKAGELLKGTGVHVVDVRGFETPSCSAVYTV